MLLRQEFIPADGESVSLERSLLIAEHYALVENSIAVLSDLTKRRSYIFYGGLGVLLGMARKGESRVVDTIWEEEIFERIAPEDLLTKQLDELKFFHFINRSSPSVRSDYYMECSLRMCDDEGEWHNVRHRISYFASTKSESVPMALCLYNVVPDVIAESRIVNYVDGSVVRVAEENCSTQPMAPQPQGCSISSSTWMWPTSPAAPLVPVMTLPFTMMAAPTPVPMGTTTTFL